MKDEKTKYVVRQLAWLGAFAAVTLAIGYFMNPYAAIAICIVTMASSFTFCRYCDRWGKNCECEPMNPYKDAQIKPL